MASNSSNLRRVLNSAARKVVTRKAQQALPIAKAKAGADAPSLGYTVQGNSYRDVSSKVSSNDPKFIYVEEGVRPHVIRPRNGKTLVFPGKGGTTTHSTVVYHPGFPGKHPLRDALNTVIKS